MPPASKKDVSVILLDLKTSSLAKQTLLKICCTKYIDDSKDLTKLILFNSSDTKNRLNAPYINEISEVCNYDPNGMAKLIEAKESQDNASVLEGLTVALKNLEDFQDIGGIVTKQVLFLTDLNSCTNENADLIEPFIRDVNSSDVFVYIVGPGIQPPFQIKSQKHVRKWMESLEVPNTDSPLKSLQYIVTRCANSVICDDQLGFNLLYAFKNFPGTMPWNVPLSIGSNINIPAQTLKILNDTVECTLVSSESFDKYNFQWVDVEDETIEVNKGDVLEGVIRHGKFVQMPEEKMFQVENPRGFSVICFTDSYNVPEYLMRGDGCYCVLPLFPDDNEAFNTLVDCLAVQKKYIIARRIYNNNLIPHIVVLIPKPQHDPKCFLMASLPFADDIQMEYHEKDIKITDDDDANSEVSNFLDSINVEDPTNVSKFPLSIDMWQDVNQQRIINKAADKIFDKYMNLEAVDLNYLQVPNESSHERLKEVWAARDTKEDEEEEQNMADYKHDDEDSEFEWD